MFSVFPVVFRNPRDAHATSEINPIVNKANCTQKQKQLTNNKNISEWIEKENKMLNKFGFEVYEI